MKINTYFQWGDNHALYIRLQHINTGKNTFYTGVFVKTLNGKFSLQMRKI